MIKFIKWIQGSVYDYPMTSDAAIINAKPKAFQPTLDSKRLAKKAYSLAVDSYKTLVCIEYPAHTIAAGCIYLASRLLKDEDESFQGLSTTEPWDQHFLSRMEDIEGMGVCCNLRFLSTYSYFDRCLSANLGSVYCHQCARRCNTFNKNQDCTE